MPRRDSCYAVTMADEPKDTSTEPTAEPKAAEPKASEPKASEPPAWRRQLDESLGDLKSAAEDIRERLERAGKTAHTEARETWKKLEPQIQSGIHTAEEKLTEATDEAVEQLKGLFGRLQGKLVNLRDKLG
jgi:ElaB/YqjD/DUF883 family membrane-anchored ribosome-binding protein